MFGVELKFPASLSASPSAEDVRAATLAAGLLTWECSTATNVIGLVPPLIVCQTEVNQAVERLLDALDHLATW